MPLLSVLLAHVLSYGGLGLAQGLVNTRVVRGALPDHATLIEHPDQRRTASIIANFNPAVTFHPAAQVRIGLRERGRFHAAPRLTENWSLRRVGASLCRGERNPGEPGHPCPRR